MDTLDHTGKCFKPSYYANVCNGKRSFGSHVPAATEGLVLGPATTAWAGRLEE